MPRVMLLAVLLPISASAADLVLHDGGDAASLAARVARDANVPVASLEVLGLQEVVAGSRALLGGAGQILACDTVPVGISTLEEGLERAARAINYLRLGEAVTELETVEAQLDCLRDPLDPRLAGRIHFLHGVVAFEAGSETEARSYFRSARRLVPDLAWDETFAPPGAVVFDSVEVDLTPEAQLRIVPAGAASQIRVDGQSIYIRCK